MANNKIQIKRSVANAVVSGLSNGELAFTQASNTLHIGLPDGSGVLRIGGAQYPGTLTNSHALVANATGGIDKVIVANAVITSITANGSAGSNGQVLVTNGTAIYWGTGTSGSNTQVQFNDSGVANASAGFTFDKVSNNLSVANTLNVANVFATNTVNASVLSVGGWVIANNGGVYTSGIVNADILAVGSYFRANTTQVTVGSGVGFSANGSLGSANQVLRSNGSSIYWDNDVGDISSITAGDGLNGGGSTGDITIDVGAGNGIEVNATTVAVKAGLDGGLISNSSGVWVDAGTGVTVNSTGVSIGQPVGTTDSVTFANVVTGKLSTTGDVVLGDSFSDVLSIVAAVNTNIIPSANLTYNVGNNTLRWNEVHAGNVHGIEGHFDSSVYVGGDIFVTGNLVTTNVQSVIISDPMIYLAGNNYTSDLVDIGFVANYFDGAKQRHTGLYRSFSDGEYRLFTNSEQELEGNNTVNTAANGFTLAVLRSYLISGGFSTNSSSANLTANATFSVSIVANTLTLSTALAGTEGGTGWKTTVSQSILVGNTSNGYDRLALGTSGYVLQSNGTALVYDVLDGGSF
jgi:hypothetical protein